MFPNAPPGPGRLSGVIEYPKQGQRIAGVVFVEIRFIEAEAESYAARQRMAELGHHGDVFKDGLAEPGYV